MFTKEDREGAARIVRKTSRPIAQLASELGINESTLGYGVVKDRELGCRPRAVTVDIAELNGSALRSRSWRWNVIYQAISGPVGQRGDQVSVAQFIAAQGTNHDSPHTLTRALCARIAD